MTDLRPGITALVACHPARMTNGMLTTALNSITKQTMQPDSIVVVNDLERAGAGRTRQKLLAAVDTEWLAWLDSDDYWFPEHLATLYQATITANAVFAFSWFDALNDPLGHFGKTFNPCNPHHTTITFLVRTELAQEVGFEESQKEGQFSEEDWKHIAGMAQLCCERDLNMIHVPTKTWHWRQQGQNSSGKPGQGDAF